MSMNSSASEPAPRRRGRSRLAGDGAGGWRAGWLWGGVAAVLASQLALPADASEVVEAGVWLRGRARELVRSSARPMTDGSGRTGFVPQAAGGYDGFWLRDYAYMLEGAADAFSEGELTDAAVLFVDSLRADGAGVDTVKLDGTPIYMPGYGTMGSNPVADGSQFTVAVAWHTFRRLGDPALLERVVDGEPLVERLVAAMNAVPRSPNGLVFIDPALEWDRAPYGFTDTVRKQGEVLFSSLLDVQAARQLGDLLEASGRTTDAATWRSHGDAVSEAIRSTFWDPAVGLFRAATDQCREHDIWGSAFAVHLGVATAPQADAVAVCFRDHYAEIVQAGQVRHLPGGTYWEVAGPRDTYQNGACWPVATGWFAAALARVDQGLADATFVAMVDDFRARGVNEWVIGSSIGVPGYTASATVPLGIMAEMYAIPAVILPAQTGGTMSEDNLALASAGATAFAKDVIAGYPQHAIAHLNDGRYGNDHSWLANLGGSFAGVAFGGPRTIGSVAFGRDNGGEATQFTDRFAGLYTLQFTRTPNPDATTPDEQWTTIASIFHGQFLPDTSGYLRHRYDFSPVDAVTGIRLVVSADADPIAIDELEAYAVAPVTGLVDGGFEAPGMTDVATASPGVLDVTGTTNGSWMFGGAAPGGLVSLLDGDWLGVPVAGASAPPADAFEGHQWISFNGGGASPGGTATQRLGTVPGQRYEVTFSLAYGSLGEDAQQQILAEVTGTGGLLASLRQAATKNQWTSHSIRFVADAPTVTLVFTDALLSGGGSSDLFLDAVSLTPLPPLNLRLEACNGGNMLRFTWNAVPGRLYDMLGSPEPGSDPGSWTPVATDLASSPFETPRPAAPAAFFVLAEKDPP